MTKSPERPPSPEANTDGKQPTRREDELTALNISRRAYGGQDTVEPSRENPTSDRRPERPRANSSGDSQPGTRQSSDRGNSSSLGNIAMDTLLAKTGKYTKELPGSKKNYSDQTDELIQNGILHPDGTARTDMQAYPVDTTYTEEQMREIHTSLLDNLRTLTSEDRYTRYAEAGNALARELAQAHSENRTAVNGFAGRLADFHSEYRDYTQSLRHYNDQVISYNQSLNEHPIEGLGGFYQLPTNDRLMNSQYRNAGGTFDNAFMFSPSGNLIHIDPYGLVRAQQFPQDTSRSVSSEEPSPRSSLNMDRDTEGNES